MSTPNLFLVIMAGGSGTRFWPKSTSRRPKQLLSFSADASSDTGVTLLEQTLRRFDGLVPENQRFIVTTRSLEKSVAEQAGTARVLAEPQGRNTAPCVYWAARVVAERDPKGVMLVMPSDHHIAREDRFRQIVKAASERAATHDELVTLGIQPDRPETGYGYLKMGVSARPSKEAIPGCQVETSRPSTHLTVGTPAGTPSVTPVVESELRSVTPVKVDAFVEKPDLEKARQFLAAGNYLWNGGMFLWRAEVILRAFDEMMPELRKAWDGAGGKAEQAYPAMTATSIDYGIMEKARNVVGFPLDCGWDDLGSWTSLEGMAEILGARHEAGVVIGGEAMGIDSTGNIVDAPGKLVALLGVKDLIVVEHGGAILVADKARAQDIKLVVEGLKTRKPELL